MISPNFRKLKPVYTFLHIMNLRFLWTQLLPFAVISTVTHQLPFWEHIYYNLRCSGWGLTMLLFVKTYTYVICYLGDSTKVRCGCLFVHSDGGLDNGCNRPPN